MANFINCVYTHNDEVSPTGVCCGSLMQREQFEFVCKKCQRIEDSGAINAEKRREAYGWAPRVASRSHLKKMLDKFNIYHLVCVAKVRGVRTLVPNHLTFLKDLIYDFGRTGRVNHVCFLFNFFQRVSEKYWPERKEVPRRLKPFKEKVKRNIRY